MATKHIGREEGGSIYPYPRGPGAEDGPPKFRTEAEVWKWYDDKDLLDKLDSWFVGF
jgi:hypothetical protein